VSCCGTGATPPGAGDAVGAGITIPGVCSWPVGAEAAGDAVGAGITMPGVCLWPAGTGVPVDLLTFGRCAVARRRIFRLGFRLAAGFGFGLLIPGITCPSCCAMTLWLK
jgi:hypothetical protein